MSWGDKRRVELGPEWPGFWLELYEDPPMGAWIDLQEAAAAVLGNPGAMKVDAIDRAIQAFRPLVAGHNLTGREGEPLEFTLRSMSSGLVIAVIRAAKRALAGEGTEPPLPLKAVRSRARSSRAKGSRRASSSGVSRSA